MEDDSGLSDFELCYRYFINNIRFRNFAYYDPTLFRKTMTSPNLTEEIFDKYPFNQDELNGLVYEGIGQTSPLRVIIYRHLSVNENISLNYISNHIDEPWNYDSINKRHNITWSDTVKYPNIQWIYIKLMDRWCEEVDNNNNYVLK
jgi:hypothetical protein